MQWVLREMPTDCNPAVLSELAAQLEISGQLASLLYRRGFYSYDDMQMFITPGLRRLAPLEDWPGLLDAARLFVQRLLAGDSVCVWGDYDVDGITAAALVTEFLRAHGFPCRYYIPNRITEGYGLNKEGLSRLAAEGVSLLLTVDTGISDLEAVAHAKQLGMTVIVSDHHLPADSLPPADALVNPRLAPCPCPALAGVGVAFLLMAASNNELHARGRSKLDIRNFLDLVALGTLADVVDLQGQNRVLVKNGLLQIGAGSRVGIAALKAACNHAPAAQLGAGQVVFSLTPRLNAAGRLGSSDVAVELLLTTDRMRAVEYADELSRLNAERRTEEDRIVSAALEQAEQQAQEGKAGLVLHACDWHPGVVGIVASRIVEQLSRPAVVLSSLDGYLKGSGRSVGGFDLHEAFSRCSSLLLGYGGHKMAAGLSLLPDKLHEFRTRFDALAVEALGDSRVEPVCKLDGELAFNTASDFTFLKELEMLQPFGMGNAEPTFSSLPLIIRNIRSRPSLTLVELMEEDSGITLQGKAWRQAALSFAAVRKGQQVRVAYTPRIDRYNGVASVELRLKDWKPVEV